MKKLVALLLALILCLGMLAGCDSDEESSEESRLPAEELDFFGGAEPTYESLDAFYRFAGSFEYVGNVFDEQAFETQWYIVDTYEEFNTLVSDGSKLDSSVFSDSFILIWRYNSTTTYIPHKIGFKDFYFDGSTAHITSYVSGFSGGSVGMASSSAMRYIIIPKGEMDISELNIIKCVEDEKYFNLFNTLRYDFSDLSYKNASTWLIDAEEEWSEFKTIHALDESDLKGTFGNRRSDFDFENHVYVIVYREKTDDFSALGYYNSPKVSSDGSLLTLEFYREENEGGTGKLTGKSFDIIEIHRNRFSDTPLSENAKAKIVIKTAYYN